MKTSIRSGQSRDTNPEFDDGFTLLELLVVIAISAMPLPAAGAQPGSVDLTFDAGELTGSPPQVSGFTVIEDMALLADGRVYIGGHLNSVQGLAQDGIARLLPNGLLDATFREHGAEFSLDGDTHRLFLQSDGKLLAGFYCTRRFTPDGTGDSSLTNCPNVIAVLPDNKLLAVANPPIRPFRLFPDGSPDPSFSTTVEVDYEVGLGFFAWLPTLVEADGRILIMLYPRVDSTRELIRLLPNGESDPSFRSVKIEGNPDSGIGISALARQSDGKYLVAGRFLQVNGVPRSRMARLLPDGTVDGSFDVKDTFSDTIFALAIQPDGKILVGGKFFHKQSTSSGGLVRLNADGSLDASFNVGTGPWVQDRLGFVKRIVLESDGRILVSGEFDEFGGVPRGHLARLHGDSSLLRLGSPQILPDGTVQLSVADYTGRTIVIEAATELLAPNWQPVWTNTVSSASFTVIDRGASGSPSRFYRALAR